VVVGPRMSLADAVEAMGKLGMLEPVVVRLHRDLDAVVIGPQMDSRRPVRVSTAAGSISLSETDERPGALEKIDDIFATVNFVTAAFPESISSQLMDQILPSLILQLVSGWLDPSMPMKLDDPRSLETFRAVTDKTAKLAQFISSTKTAMPSDADLDAWLQRIPQTWLARRKEASLVDLRTVSYNAVRQRKIVEKVETQLVSSDDVMYGSPPEEDHPEDEHNEEATDDWNAEWGDEEEDHPSKAETSPQHNKREQKDGQREEQESWDDWGDEDEEQEEKGPSPAKPPKPDAKTAGKEKPAAPPKPVPPKEITLREPYTVTHIPDALLALVSRVLADAALLSAPTFPVPALAAAVPALATVPTLLLAMHRATASAFYANEAPSPDVLMYNDAVYLAATLPGLISAEAPDGHPLHRRLRTLDADVDQLDRFARRAYGREMAAQRTVALDALAGAAGFVNCTLPLNARHYAQCVRDACARAREVGASWRGALPESARLQALGGLVAALAAQVVADVLERADEPTGISAEQSAMLKRFCDDVAALADLFADPADPARSLVHVYAPGWLRFVYLGEMLEASLADIRYLWTEGELSLEFRAEEVVELVQALFADSAHRKEAIREIKRTHVAAS
jgi:centromere/kinetochore protein ZW10